MTHTLVGANLAATRLGRSTRLGAVACILGANLPDVDALTYFLGNQDLAYGLRRGWTHGVLALFVLPLVLTAVLMLVHGIVRRFHASPPSSWLRLLALSFVAVLTHPFLDWLNDYGMRWLMPFAETWFYGDSVFIMDPWLWLILGVAWFAGRSPTPGTFVAWALFGGLTALAVSGRAPAYIGVVAMVATAMLIALFWRPRDPESPHRLAVAGLAVGGTFIAAMLSLHAFTASRVNAALTAQRPGEIERLMVAPTPINPLRWRFVAAYPNRYDTGRFTWMDGLQVDAQSLPAPGNSALWREASANPAVEGFMRWARFPWYVAESTAAGTRVTIMDARYVQAPSRGFGAVTVTIDSAKASPSAD